MIGAIICKQSYDLFLLERKLRKGRNPFLVWFIFVCALSRTIFDAQQITIGWMDGFFGLYA